MAEASQLSVAEASLLMKSIDNLMQCAICNDTLTRPKLLPCFHSFCLSCLQQCFIDQQPATEVACPLCRRIFAIPDDGLDALPAHFFVENLIDAKSIASQLATQHRCDVCCDDADDAADVDQLEKQFATSYCGQCEQFLCNQCSKYDYHYYYYYYYYMHMKFAVFDHDAEDCLEFIKRNSPTVVFCVWMSWRYHRRQTATKGHEVLSTSDELRPDQCIASRCNQHQDELLKLYCNDCKLVCCLVCFAETHKQHDCSHLDKVETV